MKTLDQQWPPGAESTPADDLDRYHRKHRLKPPQGWWQKLLVGLQNAFESVLVRASIHPDAPVYDNALFPWVEGIEREWTRIRAELDGVMQRREEMPGFQDIIKEVGTINTDQNWKTFFLMGVGMQCGENAGRCPETMRILRTIPGITTAFFSILSPRKHIPHHRGPYAGVLRLHIGLLVPEPREQCRIRIADQIHHWSEGRCLIFDDTFNHEVWNDTDGYRVVLFVDFERPLRFPFNWINHWVMNLAPLAPFLREAHDKHRKWEKQFYRKPG
jgi:beta-hydroxylase